MKRYRYYTQKHWPPLFFLSLFMVCSLWNLTVSFAEASLAENYADNIHVPDESMLTTHDASTREGNSKKGEQSEPFPFSEFSPLYISNETGHSFLSRIFPVTTPLMPSTQSVSSTSVPSSQTDPLLQDKRQQYVSTTRWLLFAGFGISLGIGSLLAFFVLTKRSPAEQSRENAITPSDYKLLGEIAAEHKKFHLAERCYRQVANLEPYNREIHYNIGIFLFQTERYTEAIKEFHLALKSELISPDIYTYLACAYLKVKQPQKAEKYYHKAQEFVPSSSGGAIHNLSHLLKQLHTQHQQHQWLAS